MNKKLLAALIIITSIFLMLSEMPYINNNDKYICSRNKDVIDIYRLSQALTGTPDWALKGLEYAETGNEEFPDMAIGDGGRSHGRFQINETFREYRIKRHGIYNPNDSMSAAIEAGRIIQDNLAELNGDMCAAISAYNQGVKGFNERGYINLCYVAKVYAHTGMPLPEGIQG